MNKRTCFFCFFLLFTSVLVTGQQADTPVLLRDTLGERLVTLHNPLFEETYAFEVGSHNFTVKRKKILDSLFYRTPDEKLHFFMVDTAEEEVYQGAPELRKINIPVDSFFVDTLFDASTGQIYSIDTIKEITIESRFLFEISSVKDFFEHMSWLDAFDQKYPGYKVAVYKHAVSGPFAYLGNYNIRHTVANLVAYMFKRQRDDWFILNFYQPEAHFKEPDIKVVVHYQPD